MLYPLARLHKTYLAIDEEEGVLSVCALVRPTFEWVERRETALMTPVGPSVVSTLSAIL